MSDCPLEEQAMRKGLPLITADAKTLKQRLQRDHNGRKKPRLQMLYRLASEQAQTRQEVAHWRADISYGSTDVIGTNRLWHVMTASRDVGHLAGLALLAQTGRRKRLLACEDDL